MVSIWDLFSTQNRYGVASRTINGEVVRSRAEKKIADYLTKNNIRYEYEREARHGFFIFSEKISRPDFYLPEYDVYVEYWGMVDVADDRDREWYIRTMRYKMEMYRKYNKPCIFLFPSNLENLDQVFRDKFRKVTGVTLA